MALEKLSLQNNQLTQIVIPNECVALKELSLYGNLSLLISSKTLEINRAQIKLFNSNEYKAKSHLGELYNKIASTKTLNKMVEMSYDEFSSLFLLLKEADKNRIYELIWKGAGSPLGDSQWGEHHCFDDIVLFAMAVQRSIFDKFNALGEVEKCKVEGEVYRSAASTQGKTDEMQKDPLWDKHHALDDLALLADALFALESGEL